MTADAIKKTYEATQNAYEALHNFENNENENEEELENIKNVAIYDYLKNQLPISTLRSTISGSLNIFIKYLFLIRLYIRRYIIHYSAMQSVSTYSLKCYGKIESSDVSLRN